MYRLPVALVAATALAAGFAVVPGRAQAPRPLEVYSIDVEGGQATLVVSPSGESMLIDAGFPGTRDARRIAAAAMTAGVKQIDSRANSRATQSVAPTLRACRRSSCPTAATRRGASRSMRAAVALAMLGDVVDACAEIGSVLVVTDDASAGRRAPPGCPIRARGWAPPSPPRSAASWDTRSW